MENKIPLLTISIWTFNRSEYLRYCLESILTQDWFNQDTIEIIISNNASTDDTLEMLVHYTDSYRNIRVTSNTANIGWDRNVLKVLQSWCGNFVWWISDDDIMLPGALMTVIDAIKKYPDIGILQMNLRLITKDGKLTWWERVIPVNDDTIQFNSLHELYSYYRYIYIGLTFLSTQVLRGDICRTSVSIPVTQFPHSCLASLWSWEKALFIGKSLIWRRCDNSDFWLTDESLKNLLSFMKVFIIWHFQYLRFVINTQSSISKIQLVKIELKNIIMAWYLSLRFVSKKIIHYFHVLYRDNNIQS